MESDIKKDKGVAEMFFILTLVLWRKSHIFYLSHLKHKKTSLYEKKKKLELFTILKYLLSFQRY